MKIFLLLICTVLLTGVCSGKESRDTAGHNVRLFYSGRIGSLLQHLPGKSYIRFSLQKSSAEEIRSLLKKRSARMVLATERPPDLPEGYRARRFAAWGTILAVHPENPLRNLSLKQARGLLQGTLGSWKQFGGPSLRIHFYSSSAAPLFPARKIDLRRTQEEEKTLVSPRTIEEYRAFRARLKGKKEQPEEQKQITRILKLQTISDEKTFSLLFTDRRGIGAFALNRFDENRLPLLTVDHIPPTLDNFRSGSYPLLEICYLITADPLTPDEERLKAYLESRSFARELYSKGFLAFPPEKR